MNITTKIRYERPNISVPFFRRSSNVASHVKTTYEDTNKINVSVTYENDDLIRVFSITYIDDKAYYDYNNDSILYQEKIDRTEYNRINNIKIISIDKT